MTRVRRINVSQVEGRDANNTNDDEIRSFGEAAIYIDNDGGPTDKPVLAIHDGTRTFLRSKVVGPGVLYGSNADAGDGSGADTIKLIPDSALHYNGGSYGNDQYIVVDPTGGEPGHIHLRAGGAQDASEADLYLGGELTCVRVSDTSDSVTIRTTNIGDPNITMNWTFDNQGNLYFPGIGNNRIGESEPGLVVSSDNSVVLQSNNDGESKAWLFGTDGGITFPDSTVQSTAWAGGRVVSVPSFSIGAAGDKAGDIAFASGYFYYCTQDYVGTVTVDWSNVSDVTDGEGHYVQADITTPSQLNGNLTITNIIANGAPAATQTVTSVELVTGNTYRFFLANAAEPWNSLVNSQLQVVLNIWRRVAWSGDTW